MIRRNCVGASPQIAGSASVVTRAPASRSAATTASSPSRCSLLTAAHGNSGSQPSAGASVVSSALLRTAVATSPASAPARTAQSATVRAKTPNVSSVGLKRCTPANGSTSLPGLNPTTPQYAAGRIIEPLVCVPIAAGTCPSATAAADPDEEPPGVHAAFH